MLEVTANRVQIRYWRSVYLTFNKLHSRTSLNLGNCHFPFSYNEDEKTKFLIFLSKLFNFTLQLATDEKGAFVRISTRVTIWWPTYSNRPGSLCPCDFYPGLTWRVACVADVISFWLVTSAKQHRYPCSGPPEQVRFEFPLTLIGIYIDNFLFKRPITAPKEQRFRHCFAEGLIFD